MLTPCQTRKAYNTFLSVCALYVNINAAKTLQLSRGARTPSARGQKGGWEMSHTPPVLPSASTGWGFQSTASSRVNNR